MSIPTRVGADPSRCPDCGAVREHPDASCDWCPYDPDRHVADADTTWADGSPAVQLHEVPVAGPVDNPAPPAELLTVAATGADRWWGWLTLTIGVTMSWLARGCA